MVFMIWELNILIILLAPPKQANYYILNTFDSPIISCLKLPKTILRSCPILTKPSLLISDFLHYHKIVFHLL